MRAKRQKNPPQQRGIAFIQLYGLFSEPLEIYLRVFPRRCICPPDVISRLFFRPYHMVRWSVLLLSELESFGKVHITLPPRYVFLEAFPPSPTSLRYGFSCPLFCPLRTRFSGALVCTPCSNFTLYVCFFLLHLYYNTKKSFVKGFFKKSFKIFFRKKRGVCP